MTPSMAMFTFVVAWCIVAFAVVPVFVKNAKSHTALEYAAAPAPVPWLKVCLINTIVSAVITAFFAAMIHFDIVPLHTMS